MSFQPAIPCQVALQHCLPPLHQPESLMLSGQPNSGAFKKCYLCLGTCVTYVFGLKSEEGRLWHQENFGEVYLSVAGGVVAHKSAGVSDDFFLMAAIAITNGLFRIELKAYLKPVIGCRNCARLERLL